MKYKKNWEETREKWINYWQRKNEGRPLMFIVARKPEYDEIAKKTEEELDDTKADPRKHNWQGFYYDLPDELMWKDMDDKYLKAEMLVGRYRQFCETHEFMAESFPNMVVDFGPGSLASYMGSDVGFAEDTQWFEPCYEDIDSWEDVEELTLSDPLGWYKRHLELLKKCKELANGDFYVDIPDLMENIDTLASLRGTSDLMCDMAIEPEEVKKKVDEVTKCYYEAMGNMYDICKEEDGSSAYTVFQIWGPGKCIKLQCDSSAMISTDMFKEVVLDSLKEQAKWGDQVLFHLDGPDMIRHLDAIMEVEGIDALQWTSGDYGPDGTCPDWDGIYEKAIKAGKSIWVKVYNGKFDDWVKNVDRMVKKFGSTRMFLHFPEMSMEEAKTIIEYANEHWSNVKGTYLEEIGL